MLFGSTWTLKKFKKKQNFLSVYSFILETGYFKDTHCLICKKINTFMTLKEKTNKQTLSQIASWSTLGL